MNYAHWGIVATPYEGLVDVLPEFSNGRRGMAMHSCNALLMPCNVLAAMVLVAVLLVNLCGCAVL